MAIDNAEKRKSISGIMQGIPGVTPNSAKDAQWRTQAGWSYSGIIADAPGAGGYIRPRIFSDDFFRNQN